MNELESEFDEIFNNRQGRLKMAERGTIEVVEYCLQMARNKISELRKSNPKYPKVYIDVVYSTSVNAAAAKSKTSNNYFIGINYGTLIILQDVFFRMLANKNIFPTVGDTSKEKDQPKIHNLQVTDLEQFLLNRPNELFVHPQDYKRVLLGQTMMAMVIEVLAYHEFAHIVFGHVGYLNTLSSNFVLNEVEKDSQPSYPFNLFIIQVLEMDADFFSMNNAMAHLSMMVNNKQRIHADIREFYENWPAAVRYWFFSIYTFYKIVGHKAKGNSTSFRFSHPPPSVRIAIILNNILEMFSVRKIKTDIDSLRTTCIETWAEVDQAFAEISLAECDGFEVRFALSTISIQFIDRLGKYSDAIRAASAPFAFVTPRKMPDK